MISRSTGKEKILMLKLKYVSFFKYLAKFRALLVIGKHFRRCSNCNQERKKRRVKEIRGIRIIIQCPIKLHLENQVTIINRQKFASGNHFGEEDRSAVFVLEHEVKV